MPTITLAICLSQGLTAAACLAGPAGYQNSQRADSFPFHLAGLAILVLLQSCIVALLVLQRRNLRRANQSLRLSESTKGAILESLEGPLAVLSSGGEITEVNSSWTEFSPGFAWGSEGNIGVGENYLNICEQAKTAGNSEASRALDGIRSVLSGENNSFEMESACECSGRRRWFRMVATPLQSALGGAVVAYRDVTGIKQAEHAVHESELRFRHVADAAPVLVWMSGSDRLCTYFNKTWLAFTGRKLEQELGDGWTQGVHPEDFAGCLASYVESFDARREFKIEYRLRRFDGQFRWIYDVGVPRYDDQSSFLGYIGSCIDITDRKVTEAALSELSGRLLTAQEEERARIARELHDSVSQRMALLQIGLEELEQALPRRAWEIRRNLHQIVETAAGVSDEIHALSHQLHPSKLEMLGLSASLASLCGEFSQQRGMQVHFLDRGGGGPVSKEVTLCLYRVAQEALRNIVKHSGTTDATLELSGAEHQLTLRIRDAGIGFDARQARPRAGIGLVSMHERVRLVGGQLKIESQPGRGTNIEVSVPVQRPAGKEERKAYAVGV